LPGLRRRCPLRRLSRQGRRLPAGGDPPRARLHLGFLLQLCELELLDRERRAAARRLKAARLPVPKALDGFDFAAAPSVNKPLILELMRCA